MKVERLSDGVNNDRSCGPVEPEERSRSISCKNEGLCARAEGCFRRKGRKPGVEGKIRTYA